jgi:hypothetical protein
MFSATALEEAPKATAIHLAFSVLSAYSAKYSELPTTESLLAEAQLIVGQGIELPEPEFSDAFGEMYVMHTCSSLSA